MEIANGLKQRIPVYVVSIALTLGVSYLTAQVAITEKIGDRPTRQEMKESNKETTDGIQRQLDDIKKQTDKIENRIEKVVDKLDRVLQNRGR